MLFKKAKKRLVILISISFVFILTVISSIIVLNDNILYFLSPTEVRDSKNINLKKQIRIGGMVKKGSILVNRDEIKFIITD
jgi:Cytochrome c-type biogenesis protein CcmE